MIESRNLKKVLNYEEIVKLFPNEIGRIEFSDAGVEQDPPFVEMRIILNNDPKVTLVLMEKLETLFQAGELSKILSKVNIMKVNNIKISKEILENVEPRHLLETRENSEQGFHFDILREEDREIFGFMTPHESPEQFYERENPTIIISNEAYIKGFNKLVEEIKQSKNIKDFLAQNGFTEEFSHEMAKETETGQLLALKSELNIIHPENLEQMQNQVAFRRMVNKHCYFAFPSIGTLYLLRNDLHKHKLGSWYEDVNQKTENPRMGSPVATTMPELPVYRIRGRIIGALFEELKN